ncbi:PilX N-terminal domain-containing pilus assembly protein [Trichococcus flocculiformis]|uniref:PilX N-terminal domain-containing pilus assembly protein n=1 Tax=Trichococcus flocculiformis TaxID=82803 RepID=UPI003DA50C90
MGIKHLREDEKGSGLVLTLMVLLVLSVLGVSIGTLTLGSYRLSASNRDDTSAYYVAEAAAVAAYDEIQRSVLSAYQSNATEGSFYNQVSSIVTFKNGQSAVDFGEQFGTEPTATIATAQNDTNSYTITSTGEVDGKKRTVTKPFTVNWVEKNTGGNVGLPVLPEKTVLLVNEKMDLLGGTLKGNAYIQSIQNNAVKMGTYGSFKESTLHYSDQTTPDNLINYQDWFKDKLPNLSTDIKNIDFNEYQKILTSITAPNITEKLPLINGDDKVQDADGNLKITDYQAKNYVLDLESDVYIPEIKITWTSNDSSFNINTNGQNRTILVDTLDIAGNIKVIGGGKLTVYVTNKFKINNNNLYLNEGGNLSQLTFVYLGEGAFHLDNSNKINGHMIVKNANVKVDSIPINGIFLTGSKSIQLTGGNASSNMMLIAPDAAVSISGSYSINGSVIANQFDMRGGARLEYASVDTTGFPFGPSAPAVDPEPEDIISAGPIIEN